MQNVNSDYYPSPRARQADLIVHMIGLVLSTIGGLIMLLLSTKGNPCRILPLAIYSGGLTLMIGCSLAYNLNSGELRPLLRRLDHIAIFCMIAGTYTPLTTLVLTGHWAWGMTASIWGLASLGIYAKATSFDLPDWAWTALYLALGWLALVAIGPIAQHVPMTVVRLLITGGIVYTIGSIFYVTERSRYWRSIWHGHVIVAAAFHWAAIRIALL